MVRKPTISNRAAQYVRMSTDHQQYSTANQRSAIAAWAADRNIEIVCTYEDAGRSGLTLVGRPALRKLIADVLAQTKTFDTILVYDISRWGRFQDADESAHLEYLCRSSGFSVHYCAEPFSNDGTPFASLYKVLKRTLAAEYSRELSIKVRAGKARLAALGFYQGGTPSFGLQRLVLDRDGAVKGILRNGERKSIATDRVVLAPGSPSDVATVRWIYKAYADQKLSVVDIRDALNAKGVKNLGRPWSIKSVSLVLSSPKYVGDYFWGMSSCLLQGSRVQNDRSAWIKGERAIQPIVSQALFDRVAARRKKLARPVYTDEELLLRLKKVANRYGRVSKSLLLLHRVYTSIYVNRFGSMPAALAKIGISPPPRSCDAIWLDKRSKRRSELCGAIHHAVQSVGGHFAWHKHYNAALINGALKIAVCPVRAQVLSSGQLIWRLGNNQLTADLTLMERVDESNSRVDLFVLSPREARRSFAFRQSNEALIECLRVEDLRFLSRIAELVPLDGAALALIRTPGQSPYDIDPKLRISRHGYHRSSMICQVETYVQRRRRLIRKASATWYLTGQVVTALDGWLRRQGVLEALQTSGLRQVPAVLLAPPQPIAQLEDKSTEGVFGPRDLDGVCFHARELLADRHLSEAATCWLAKVTDRRQVSIVCELNEEKRWSTDLVRVLCLVSPARDWIRPHGRRSALGLFSKEASKLELPYRTALANYPAEAMKLATVTAFARRLVYDDCFKSARKAAGSHYTHKLREAVTEVVAWRTGREHRIFGRGHSP